MRILANWRRRAGQRINNLILKNFSLRRVIESVTILDTAKVINRLSSFAAL